MSAAGAAASGAASAGGSPGGGAAAEMAGGASAGIAGGNPLPGTGGAVGGADNSSGGAGASSTSGGAGGSGGLGGGAGSAGSGSAGLGGGPGQRPFVHGFASTVAKGLTTTTGGGDSTPILISSCAELSKYLADAQPRVLEVAAGTTLDCRTAPRTQQACELQCGAAAAMPVYWRVPVGEYTCTSLADTNGDGTLDVPPGKLVNKSRNEIAIQVGSNKTLRGLGTGATLKGVSLNIENQSNVIIQNLKISEINPDLVEAGDGVSINGSHHVWIDHCEFSMISDGYLDVRYGSSAVTVSHNRIVGKNQYVCGGQHHYISLVSDSQVTFSHNYFDHPSGRNPKVSDNSQTHIYSSYYEGVSYFCASASAGAKVLVEGNYYLDSRYPHWADGGSVEATGNRYAGTTSSEHRDSNADVFTPPYAYTLGDVASLPKTVPANAGVGKL